MDLLNRDPSAGRPDGADVLARLRVTETSSFRHRMMSAIPSKTIAGIGRQPHLEHLDACLAETQWEYRSPFSSMAVLAWVNRPWYKSS
jgi:hypothetical protein